MLHVSRLMTNNTTEGNLLLLDKMSFQSTIRFDEKKTETISVVYAFFCCLITFLFLSVPIRITNKRKLK